MSDEELAASCKRNRLEEWLHGSGCYAGLFVGLAVCAALIVLSIVEVVPWSWCVGSYLAIVSIPISVFSVYGLFEWLASFRCQHFLRELEGRYGCRPLNEYVKVMQKEVGPAEIVMILVGRTLPLCQNWWICLRIADAKSGNVEARFGPTGNAGDLIDFGAGNNPKESFEIAKGELDPKVAGRLADLAGKIHRRRIRMVSVVKDGFPVSCAIIFGKTRKVSIISCNLAGIPDSLMEQSELVKEVFATGRGLIDSPSAYGSCNMKTGEIRIDGL